MATASANLTISADDNGRLMTSEEFDLAEFDRGPRYELIRGVLIVSPAPAEEERDPNEELGYFLRNYHESHAEGSSLNKTLPEHTIHVEDERRRADRVIWAGLGRLPKRNELPAIIVEFVSAGKRSRQRDYEEKRDQYLALDIKEYWIFDRFARTLTVHSKGDAISTRVLSAMEVYATPLLPGFEVPIGRLFDIADEWSA